MDEQEILARLMEAQNEAQRLAIQLLQAVERRGPQPAASATGRGPVLVLVEKAG